MPQHVAKTAHIATVSSTVEPVLAMAALIAGYSNKITEKCDNAREGGTETLDLYIQCVSFVSSFLYRYTKVGCSGRSGCSNFSYLHDLNKNRLKNLEQLTPVLEQLPSLWNNFHRRKRRNFPFYSLTSLLGSVTQTPIWEFIQLFQNPLKLFRSCSKQKERITDKTWTYFKPPPLEQPEQLEQPIIASRVRFYSSSASAANGITR